MHVKIDDSVNLRKKLLKTAIDTARLIKQNEEIKDIKEKKLEQINIFNSKIRQIKASINSLRNGLPLLKEEKPAAKEKKDIGKPASKAIKKEMTEIDILSSEINQLENKLRSL